MSFVREKEQSTKVNLIQKFVNKSMEQARDKNQIDSSSAAYRQEAEADGANGTANAAKLPNSTQLIQVLNVQPFLCYIEDLHEGAPPRPVIAARESVDPQSARATLQKPPGSSSDGVLKNIWKRQLLSTPCHFQYSTSEMIELQTAKKEVQQLKAQVTELASQGKDQLSPTEYQPAAEELSNSDDNFKFCSRIGTDLGLAELHLTFNDLIVIKGVARQYSLLTEDSERRIQVFEEIKKRGTAASGAKGQRPLSIAEEEDEGDETGQAESEGGEVRGAGQGSVDVDKGQNGGDELVDYDEEDLDSDEDQDYDSEDSPSLDSDAYSGPKEKVAKNLQNQRARAKAGPGSSLDEQVKQSMVQLKQGAASTSSPAARDDWRSAEEECDFVDSDEGSEHINSPSKGVQRINESRPSNMKVSQL